MASAAALLWQIWKSRNGAVYEQKILLPGVVCKRAVDCHQEYVNANQSSGRAADCHQEFVNANQSSGPTVGKLTLMAHGRKNPWKGVVV